MRRVGRLFAVLTAMATLAMLAASPAFALPPANSVRETLALAGSDTTQDFMGVVAADFNINSGGINPGRLDNVVNVAPVPAATGFRVPGDQACGNRLYITGGGSDASIVTQDPINGSTAGRNALAASAGAASGCIDVARSSSGPSSSDPATFEYYAYARDAVSWAAFEGGSAPADRDLTLAELRAIYACQITNWSQVGGADAQIIRFIPQAGSGTRAFFLSSVLAGVAPAPDAPGCPLRENVQENSGQAIPESERSGAILPYSAAQWITQANGRVTDIRFGTFVGAIDGGDPVIEGPPARPNVDLINSGTFVGTRLVYNVLDTRSPGYASALRVVGFDDTGASRLCSGALSTQLQNYGFTPLPSSGGRSCTLS